MNIPLAFTFVHILFLLFHMQGNSQSSCILVHNGTIYTANPGQPVVSALVFQNGKVLATGNASDLRNHYSVGQTIDLEGRPAYPGFADPHCHFYKYGLTLNQVNLSGTRSVQQILEILDGFAKKHPNGWIVGRGWDQNDWPNSHFPAKEDLDSLFPHRPVYLTRIDGHAAWVNSTALKLAGISKASKTVGGEVLGTESEASGMLIDNAMNLVEALIPQPSHEENIQALQEAERHCFEAGLTLVGDAGLDAPVVKLIDSLQQAGMLSMFVYAMLNPTNENQESYIKNGPFITDKLSVRSIKLFADGALGSRGALLKSDYSDQAGNRGVQVTPTHLLEEYCQMGLDRGYQVNTHCIGDSANALMLKLYARFLKPGNDLRWRIEHAQVVSPSDMFLFARYRIIPSVQTTHATSDMHWAQDRLGKERIGHAYSYRSLLELNGWLPNGSDFPVESIYPILGFYAAITRQDPAGNPPQGFRPEQALTRQQALMAMTQWATQACFEESRRGSLEPGKRSDFVILDRDIMAVPVDEIVGTRVTAVYIDGNRVY